MSFMFGLQAENKLKPKTKTMLNSMYHMSSALLEEERIQIENAKKNPEKFGPLYRKYYEPIFRYVYKRMDDIDTVEDVTSMVFVKALANIHRYEFRGIPFSSWLFRIAKSELNQAFRDKKGERTVRLDKVVIGQMMDELVENDSELNRNKLLNVLTRLKADQLELIEMRFFEKRSFREIGDFLDMTENNAKVKTFRAVNKLKQLFNKLE
jgi:RNA polymerase sigma-70 factor (ECF subfamily)